MNAKKRKQLRNQMRELTRAQLVALATQKGVLSYQEALTKTKDELVDTLVPVEGVLKPVAV